MKGEPSSCLPGTLIGERLSGLAEVALEQIKMRQRASPISSQSQVCSFADNH